MSKPNSCEGEVGPVSVCCRVVGPLPGDPGPGRVRVVEDEDLLDHRRTGVPHPGSQRETVVGVLGWGCQGGYRKRREVRLASRVTIPTIPTVDGVLVPNHCSSSGSVPSFVGLVLCLPFLSCAR